MTTLPYRVSTFRQAGLEAKWSKTRRGQPYIAVRNPGSELSHQREKWWACDQNMFDLMQECGIVEGFDSATLLGDIFSLRANGAAQ